MIIRSKKIPLHMKHLPELVEFINSNYGKFTYNLCLELEKLEGSPTSSNVSYKVLAKEFRRYSDDTEYIWFEFYRSKNPFWGKNVISHATNGHTVNYNTRFHSASSYELVDWVANFYHELTHLVDQRSSYSFDHKSQDEYNAAPMVVGRIARVLFQRHDWK